MSIALENSWKLLAAAVTLSKSQAAPLPQLYLTSAELSLLDSIPGIVSVHAKNGNLIWANCAFKDEFGIIDSSDGDLSYLKNMNPQDQAVALNALGNASENTQSVQLKWQRSIEGGRTSVCTYEMQCSEYSQQTSGERSLVLAIFRNVTDHIDKLEAQRNESTGLERKLREQSEFFASMSHELRTPLNAIIGFSELLEGKLAIPVSDDKRVEYAGDIHKSASHLLGLINNVLDLSKIEAGKREPHLESVDCPELLDASLRLLAPLADAKDIRLEMEADADLPELVSDKQALQQIVINLVSNAIKFSDPSSKVLVELRRRRKTLTLSVSDNGIGMNDVTQARLGDVFFQVDSDIAKPSHGSGLGLSIVYKLVEVLGGEIEVESKESVGTSVYVTLPLSNEASRPVPTDPQSEIVFLRADENLCVEDHLPLNRQIGVN